MNLRRFGVWANLAISAALMLVVWTLLVWVSSRPTLRALVDMTPQRVNTVSRATTDLLQDLRLAEAEIEFHLFRGEFGQAADERGAQVVAIRTRVLELTSMLLKRYAALGGENVKVIEHDRYSDPAGYRTAAQAFAYTQADSEALVVAVRQKGSERRFRKLSLITDLSVIDTGGQAQGPNKANPLPVLKDYQGEKGISSALKGLLVQGTPIVYLIEGHSVRVDIRRRDHDYNQFIDAMTQAGMEVRSLNLREAGGVPTDANLVVCIEPTSEFLPRDAEFLYSYLERGGRLFINYAWSAILDMNPNGGRLGELLGYDVSARPVFHRIPDGGRGGGSTDGTDGVMRLTLQKSPFHPVTRRLAESGRTIEFFMGRQVSTRRDKPKNIRVEELLATGGEGWLGVVGSNGMPDLRSPNIKLRPHVVGVSCELDPGARNAEGGDPNKPESDDDQLEQTASAERTDSPDAGRAVILAGLFCNDQLFPHFGDLAMNICNWMTERKVLLDIETARYTMNSIDVQQPQFDRIWWLLVVWVPSIFLVLGLSVWWRRRH